MDDIALVVLFVDRHTVMWAFLDKSSYLGSVGCTNRQRKNDHLSNHCGIRDAFDQFLEIRCSDQEATRSTVRHFYTPGDGDAAPVHELSRRVLTGSGNGPKPTLARLGHMTEFYMDVSSPNRKSGRHYPDLYYS